MLTRNTRDQCGGNGKHEPRKQGKPIYRYVIKLITAVDDWRSIYLGSSEEPCRKHLRIVCPKDGREDGRYPPGKC